MLNKIAAQRCHAKPGTEDVKSVSIVFSKHVSG